MMWRMSGIKIASGLPLPISRSLSEMKTAGPLPRMAVLKHEGEAKSTELERKNHV